MKLFSKIRNKKERKIRKRNTNKANKLYEEANSIIFGKKSFSPHEYILFLKAIDIYTKAIELDPKQILFYNKSGFAYYQVTEVLLSNVSQDGRIGFFCKTDNRFKENSTETGLLSAEVREILNDCIQQSLNNFSKVLELEPNDATSLVWRGNVFIDLGRFDEALQDLEKAKSVTDDSGLRDRATQDIDRVKKLLSI
jgi:tetratricopeptide (TPR) repeat protein